MSYWNLPQEEKDLLRLAADAAEEEAADRDARILAKQEDDAAHEREAGPLPERDCDWDPWEEPEPR